MLEFLGSRFKNKYWQGYLIITILVLIISVLNVKIGHYLIGWDNLQVELNYWENLRRSIFAAWQEYQGLGLASGHAHAVETVRLLVYLPAYLLLPNWFFRYFFHLSMLMVGGLAVYSLTYHYLTKKRLDVSLVAAIFYLVNIGTVQIFFAALEPFSAFWAFFPLNLYFSIKYLYRPTKRNYIWLVVSQLLLTIAYQIQTFAVVYLFVFIIPVGFYFFYCIFNQRYYVKRIILVFIGLFFTNLYWIGSAVYFFLNNSSVRFSSLNNKLGSEDAFLMNVAYSNFKDIFLMRGFWFGNIDYNNKLGEFGYMMEPWAKWWDNSIISIFLYLILTVMLIGLFVIVQKQRKLFAYLLYLLFLSIFFLFNVEGPLGYAYQSLIQISPTLKEIFRFPFTKWAAVYTFSYTIFFAMGYKIIADNFYRISKHKISKWFITSLTIIIIFISSFPILQGQLFYDRLELAVPSDYFKAFDYLSTQDKNYRIMNLPQNTFWGWFFTDWGYRGSGFIWWGISQPIVDRAFDVWNPMNEQYYNELHYAIYSKNKSLFENVLKKYNIGFIWIDDSIVVPNAGQSTQNSYLKSLLQEISYIDPVFESGKIHIYSVQKVMPNIVTPFEFSEGKKYSTSEYDINFIDNNTDYYSEMTDSEVLSDDYIKANFNEDLRLMVNNPYPKSDVNISFPTSFRPSNIPVVLSFDEASSSILFRYPAYKILDKNSKIIYENRPIGQSVKADLENNNYYFQGDVLTEPVDSYLVFPSDSYYISFSKSPISENDFSSRIYSANVSDCSGNTSAFGKSFDKYPGSVIISGLEGSACLNFDDELVNTDSVIYKVSFEMHSAPDSEGYYCLYNAKIDECVNKKYERGPQKSSEYMYYEDYVFIENPAELSFHLANESRNKEGGDVYFRNIKIEKFSVLEIGLISLSDDEQEFITVPVSVDAFPIKFDLTDLSSLRYTYSAGDDYYKTEVKSCDRFRSGSVNRTYKNDTYYYTAINGTSCDELDLPQILPSASYFINVNAQNITGKALDFCVAGQGYEKCMIQNRLNSGQDHFILPEYPDAKRYYVDIRNQSYGDRITENILNSISFTYIPYNWLKGIKFENASLTKYQVTTRNAVTMTEYNKLGYHKYKIDVKKTVGTNGYIQLNQSFDNGWILYKKGACGFWGNIFPLVCSNTKYQHVLSNNWANGWIIPNEDAEYIAVFWPQYLQFYGTGFLIIFIILFAVRYLFCSKYK